MLQLQGKVDLVVMAMKGYAQTSLELHHQTFSVISKTLVWGGYYPFAVGQFVYSIAQADWASIINMQYVIYVQTNAFIKVMGYPIGIKILFEGFNK